MPDPLEEHIASLYLGLRVVLDDTLPLDVVELRNADGTAARFRVPPANRAADVAAHE